MAHYAFLDENNIVTEVIVGIDENETIDGLDTETWYGNFRNQVCKRTSYNGKIRKQFAGIGYKYDSNADVFVMPQPYPSWTLDNNFDWQPPIPFPNTDRVEGVFYSWNEEIGNWVEALAL